MKQYFVLKSWNEAFDAANVVFSTDSRSDAEAYVGIMRRNNADNIKFAVVCTVEENNQ